MLVEERRTPVVPSPQVEEREGNKAPLQAGGLDEAIRKAYEEGEGLDREQQLQKIIDSVRAELISKGKMSVEGSIPTVAQNIQGEKGASEFAHLLVEKRDGKLESFEPNKIAVAIRKAYQAKSIEPQEELIKRIIGNVTAVLHEKSRLKVEEIQDLVVEGLKAGNEFIAMQYSEYRHMRNVERASRSALKHTLDDMVDLKENDTNLSNANMSSATPAGMMMNCASEHFKAYSLDYLVPSRFVPLHREGDIHIHDLDYYPTKTSTCVQYDMESLYTGFRTKNGSVRTPQCIPTYATLSTIVFQTNQNEQHGGQSIPAYDFFLAPGVRKSYHKSLAARLRHSEPLRHLAMSQHKMVSILRKVRIPIEPSDAQLEMVRTLLAENGMTMPDENLRYELNVAYEDTIRETHQSMEGFIHNLNTMHSRGGNQVVFSSVNYGTDTSEEGRLLIKLLLRSTMEGLGNGEVPIFPIQIFKVKEGVNFSKRDFELAMSNYEAAERGELQFETPNFDLFLEACRTNSRALFPNFLFLDSTFNRDELWKSDDPHRYFHEVATMGCRTRVYENINGPRTSVGRGNLSFTSINMPRLAIKARQEAERNSAGLSTEEIQECARGLFLDKVRWLSAQVAEQLKARYDFQRTALARQFPFMMGNNVWKGGDKIHPNAQVGDVLLQGTLGIGFIGGHNAMMAIYGQGHGQNDQAWQTLYDAVLVMNEVANEYKQRYGLNYSVLATPAEGLAGRFTKLDKKLFGTIAGVNDRDYYVNSFHIDVKEQISINRKIEREAPFHAITLGGHITYVELDGEAKKNTKSILRIVEAMWRNNIGYGSINHPVDTCAQCGYKGVIYNLCPVCKGDKIERLRRITGYLTGNLDSWNAAKRAEEGDRVKHS